MAGRLSLRQRLIGLILIASGGALLLVVGAMLVYELSSYRPNTEKRLNAVATVLAEGLKASLEFTDTNRAGIFLKTAGASQQVQIAAVYDANTNHFADFCRAGTDVKTMLPMVSFAAQFGAHTVSLWRTIEEDNKIKGYLYLQERIPPFYARSSAYEILVCGVILVLVFMATLLMAGLQRHLIRPLSGLVETTAKVTRNADYSLRADISQKDELGHLAHAFNQMLEAIGQRDAALREASAQIQKVFNAATEVAIIATDVKGLVQQFNSGAERMLGYPAAEIVGRHTPELWHLREEIEAHAQGMRPGAGRELQGFEAIVEPARQGLYEPREWTFARKDGARLAVQLVITTIRDEQNTITGFLGVANDVTGRRRAELALRESEAKFRTLFDTANDAIFMSDESGFRSCNPQALKIFGGKADEIIGHSPAEFSPATQPNGRSSSDLAREKIEGAFAGQPQFFEWRHRRLDQTLFDAEVSLNRIELGGKAYVQGIVRDITNRKRAELELQRREEYFRLLIEHSSDSITVIDAKAIVTYQSASGERVLGYPARVLLGRCLLDLAHPADLPQAQAALQQALGQLNVPVTLAVRLRHQDGAWRHIEAVGTSIRTEAGGIQVILNSRDVSNHLHLEEQLRQAQKMEAVGRLAGGVAHDFNNILSALLMQSEMLQDSESLPAEVREGFNEIIADVNRAAALTRQLLLFSRRQVMQLQVLDLNELITNLGRMLQRLIREDVQLQLHLHSTPLRTRADAGMLEQVLVNLAVNARDAMPDGGRLRLETASVTLGREAAQLHPDAAPGRYVSMSVSDTGGGIPPEVLPKIFEPFFTTKAAGQGTGLGLATVFGIVKQHQGWIVVDNHPGAGVTFQIFLPGTTATSTDAPPTAVKPKLRGGVETIFLVEDEEGVRKPTRKLLERWGYQVVEAANGVEALQCWPQYRESVALLFTDLVMPGGLSGQELARRLQADKPGLKVILASGYSAELAGKDFQLNRGETFVQKPFATERLLEAIRQSLGS